MRALFTKNIFLIGFVCSIVVLFTNEKVVQVSAAETENKVELNFIQGDKLPDTWTDDQDNNYKPNEPENIKRLLPQTGETILSFMFILIGLSIVLIVVGIMTMRRAIEIYSFY